MDDFESTRTPVTPRGSLWAFTGLLIILLVVVGAALESRHGSYDICDAGMDCFGTGLFFAWFLAGPLVALTSIVALVRASRDRRAGAQRPLRTAVLTAGWVELAIVVVPPLWVIGEFG